MLEINNSMEWNKLFRQINIDQKLKPKTLKLKMHN